MPYLYKYPKEKFLPQGVKKINTIKDKRVLAFSPHADDLSIGVGGFLAQLSVHNEILPVLAFSGWRGVGGKLLRNQAIKVRQREMCQEAKILGLKMPLFLNLKSYDLDNLSNRRHDIGVIQAIILKEKPDIIFSPNLSDLHPRHKQLAEFIDLAIKMTLHQVKIIFYYEIPWSVFSSNSFNFIVPLDKESFQKKIKAISAHKSQLVRTNFIRLSKALLALRAGMVPEQKINGYGQQVVKLGNWVEVFKYKEV